MDRRSFLASLLALGVESRIPRGTAFSFLGGIYRPSEWIEIPTDWPLPSLEIRGAQTLTIAPDPVRVARGECSPFVSVWSVAVDTGAPNPTLVPAARFDGLCVPYKAQLFRNRQGSAFIRPRSDEPVEIRKAPPYSSCQKAEAAERFDLNLQPNWEFSPEDARRRYIKEVQRSITITGRFSVGLL